MLIASYKNSAIRYTQLVFRNDSVEITRFKSYEVVA